MTTIYLTATTENIEILSVDKLDALLSNIESASEWMRSETRFGFPALFSMVDHIRSTGFSGDGHYYYAQNARYHPNTAVRQVAWFCKAACGHQSHPTLGEHSAGTVRILHDKAVQYLSNTVIRG